MWKLETGRLLKHQNLKAIYLEILKLLEINDKNVKENQKMMVKKAIYKARSKC